jgi:hypothetical protein
MTGRDDAAWLADPADTAEADEFLRTPAGIAALTGFCRAHGSVSPRFEAGTLIDEVSFTALMLRSQVAAARRS